MTNEQLCSLAQSGNLAARNLLLEKNQAFLCKEADGILRECGDCRIEKVDLIQEGCLALIEAVERFDPHRGNKFLTYAVYWVRKFMREATNALIADSAVSLDTLEKEATFFNLYEEMPEQIVLGAETIEEVQAGLRQITARERTYLLYRYGFTDGDEHSILETAAHFNLTEKRAKKTEYTALDDLRSKLLH